jgi:hypothetical protein
MIKYLLLTACLSVAHLSGAQLVKLSNNKLAYQPYANKGQNNAVNILPDFSSCGYKKGGVALPSVETIITLKPKSGDCREMIQQAIDELSARSPDKNGFRGALLLKRGVYHVDGLLKIEAGGVIVRGEGAGIDGTILLALQKNKSNFITLQGHGKNDYGIVKNSTRKIIGNYIPSGVNELTVEQGHGFSAGEAVVIQETPNDQWIKDLDMAQYGWTANQYKMMYERTVTAIKGNVITIDIPIVDPIEDQYGGAVIFKSTIIGRITNSGIENLRIESTYENDQDENHGWNAIVLNRAEHCWVKNVVAKYFGYACVNVDSMSAFNTIEDCAMIDPKSVTTGGRKYSFNISHGSTGNLFQRCVSWGGRHDYVTGARVPGPNVFLDCVAENTFADVGPHHRWSTGLLFDNVYGGEIRAQNRKAMGSGHGWAGAQTLFWNCYSTKKEIKVESPPGAMNWGIGCAGLKQNGDGYWESWGNHVSPRSLYLKQLEERLGTQAVNNVTTSEQRSGPIWDLLKGRAAQIVEESKVTAQ